MQGLLAAAGGWRTAILIVRAAAAASLLVGVGLALPIVEVDVAIRYSPSLAVTFLRTVEPVPWWQWVARQPAAEAALVVAALGVAATAYRKSGQFDSVSLALTALGWSFAFLQSTALLTGLRSPAFDGVLVVGFAGTVVGFAGNVSGRLSGRGRLAIFGFLIGVALVVLEALLADSVARATPMPLGAFAVTAIVALVACTAWQFLPWVTWHRRLPGRPIRLAVLVAMPAVLAGGVLAAAAARQAAATIVLAGPLGAALVVYGAILAALRVRRPLRMGVDLDLDRPPARVFRELTDLRTPLADGSSERGLEALDDRPIGLGSRLRWHTGDQQTETVTVTAFDAPALFEYRMDAASYAKRVWFGIEPADGGGSRVRWRERLDVPLYWWIQPGYRRQLDRGLADTAERLRAGRRFADDEPTGPAASAD